MPRTREEEAEWHKHRDELKALWLDQRWTLEQIQEHMSQRHSFRKSTRGSSRSGGLKKNLTDEDWKFVAHRREKRKRDGKDPGDVRVHGNLIPEPKVRKETARHVSLASQYSWIGDSGVYLSLSLSRFPFPRPYAHPFIILGPKTPEGVVVGTPRLEIDATVCDDSANIHAMDCSQILSVDGMNLLQSADRDPLTFHIELPELSYPEFSLQGNEEPTATSSYLGDATLEHRLSFLTSASTPTSTNKRTLIQYNADSVSNAIADETRLALLWQIPLHRAVRYNKAECARMLLEAGADPNLAVDGATPLHTACSKSEALDMVGLLLQFGAHVNPPQDCARLTPLQLAVQNGEPELVQLLLDNKANPNAFTTSKKGTPSQMACRNSADAEIVELLIAAGADIDSRSSYRCDSRNFNSLGDSDTDSESEEADEGCLLSCIGLPDSFKPPILVAAENLNWEVVQLLLEEGADVNASLRKCPPAVLDQELDDCNWGSGDNAAVFTPLQAAVRAQNITMIRMLLSAGAHIDARPKGKYGHTALQICAMVGNERITEILLRKGADVNAPAGVYLGRIALQAAAVHSDTTVLSTLLREGADVNAPPAEKEGKTALQIAVAGGNTEGDRILLDANAAVNTDPNCTEGVKALQEAIRIGDSAIRNEIVYQLLRAGAHTEGLQNQKAYAPLHAAVARGDLEMTRKLLEKGANADVGFCAQTERTPLQQASFGGNEDLVQVLIDHGADVNGPPWWSGGRTALQAAVENGHVSMVKMLLKFGARIKSDRAQLDGISVMEAAAKRGDQELVQLFLEKEPDIISSDPITKSQVIGLALNSWKCDVPLLGLLLKGGAVVNNNPSPPSKRSFLQIAATRHNFKVVQCLLSAGAYVNHRWESTLPGDVTALQAAVSTRNTDIVQLLLERGADVNAPANKNGGKTALQIAVSQNHRVMTELLVHHGADVNGLPSPVRGRTALQEAASSGYVQLSEYLLAHGADVNAPAAHLGGVTALQGAAMQGNIRIVMMLLLAGADVNGAPAIEQGLNAIEAAAGNGRLDTLHLLLNYHPDILRSGKKERRNWHWQMVTWPSGDFCWLILNILRRDESLAGCYVGYCREKHVVILIQTDLS
ncbi:hypothetical protein CFD26_104148 [Aspergillus turcosus]|uniref:Clr5 domain-containing protein n=1 Tax=Aspergillus turcosus TaxID=1245748 RepID=A0A3R7F3K3_9EURO|nr:hypothetical protein CFD26_104148 [Aspergillus turcosus]